jgi:hypothetical protein
MFRGIGISVLFSWICLNAFAQLPHPNDTLENGKKVPFNQFLGRFSVFNEFYGLSYPLSFNLGYSLIKTDLLTTDLTIGAMRLGHSYTIEETGKTKKFNQYNFPVSLSLFIGRRKSKLNVRVGYMLQLYPSWYTDTENPYPSCGYLCPSPPRQHVFLSLGYTYQHQFGFFIGASAYGIVRFPDPGNSWGHPNEFVFPMGGLIIGYRLPSRQLHLQWKERGFKRRILRL